MFDPDPISEILITPMREWIHQCDLNSHKCEFQNEVDAEMSQRPKQRFKNKNAISSQTFLSRTFRDAISVTRGLDIPCIWINSLCTIQDDENDWARESTQIVDVYLCAYLTIAPLASML